MGIGGRVNHRRFWRTLAITFVVVPGCLSRGVPHIPAGGDRPVSGRLVVTGSSTVAPLMVEIGRRYEARHPGVRIDVQSGGSSRGVADVIAGRADVGMLSRGIRNEEVGLQTTRIANDGIGVIVHRKNSVGNVTVSQVAEIFSGQIRNWHAVGGQQAAIVVASKAEGRGTREAFLGHLGIAPADAHGDVIVGGNQQAIKTVAGNPLAIGYVSIGAADQEIENGTPIKLLALDGTAATSTNVAEGSYPIRRPLSLITTEITTDSPQSLTASFVEFACSSQVRDLVEAQYFVPLRR